MLWAERADFAGRRKNRTEEEVMRNCRGLAVLLSGMALTMSFAACSGGNHSDSAGYDWHATVRIDGEIVEGVLFQGYNGKEYTLARESIAENTEDFYFPVSAGEKTLTMDFADAPSCRFSYAFFLTGTGELPTCEESIMGDFSEEGSRRTATLTVPESLKEGNEKLFLAISAVWDGEFQNGEYYISLDLI